MRVSKLDDLRLPAKLAALNRPRLLELAGLMISALLMLLKPLAVLKTLVQINPDLRRSV